ncbi:hypothetical protein V2J09_010805 [Rumex salicifolius]
MTKRIQNSAKHSRLPNEIYLQHKGFSEWTSSTSKHDHQTILQILINGRRSNVKDAQGMPMPNLIYLAREKRSEYFHNFKAGAMNALIRVSSKISNGPIILNVDCDMYCNDSQSIRDALCFFMDEKQSQDIGYVQFPQVFDNMTKNDLYGSSLRVIREVDFHGLDGIGGPLYIGSGCFHLREVLCGRKYDVMNPVQLLKNAEEDMICTTLELELNASALASCSYELDTEWGKEVGLKYGYPVEDVITGLSIQCRGWKTAYYNPTRPGFVGIAPTSLNETLVQHKRWSEGDFQIFLSKYCPLWFGHSNISPLLQMGYLNYCLWACNSFATLFYSTIPSLFLINAIPLYPEVSSPWFIPFAFIILASYGYSLVEFLHVQGSFLEWWNEQRMWLYKRVSSYLFAFVDSIMRLVGLSNMNFVITAKVADEDIIQRYIQEKMEFGVSSPMFTILATLALVNLFCAVIALKEFTMGEHEVGKLGMQVLLCAALVAINLPLYDALILRNDKGRIPSSIAIRSIVLALLICTCFSLLV